MAQTLAERLAAVKPETLFVGVDLGLGRNVGVVMNERGQRLARFSFSNDSGGYAYFRSRLKNLQEGQQGKEVLVGMEPTNYYWKLVAADLEQYRIDYRLVNAYTVKKHREGSQLDRSKDDARDALAIADVLRNGQYTETRLLHGSYAELRQYAWLCDRLRREIHREKNMLVTAVGQLFPELRQVFKNLMGVTALAMLRYNAAACVIRKESQASFINGVRSVAQGKRLQVAKLCHAHTLAATSVGVEDGVQALQLMVRQRIESLVMLERQRDEARTTMIDIFLTLPESRYFLSMHNLGQATAATILAEIGDPTNYHNARQWPKLAGIQPVPNMSGNKKRSRTPMSHQGRPRLRTAVFFAVMRLVQSDETFAREYQQLQLRKKNPLTKMQALGVLMNKLLRILWALVRHQTFYNPAFELVA